MRELPFVLEMQEEASSANYRTDRPQTAVMRPLADARQKQRITHTLAKFTVKKVGKGHVSFPGEVEKQATQENMPDA